MIHMHYFRKKIDVPESVGVSRPSMGKEHENRVNCADWTVQKLWYV